MKKGLVLEGGAMRGLFTAGVIDVMLENHIEYDGMIGVSAGAAFGCNYKSEQAGRVIRYNKHFCNDKRYCSYRSLISTGNIFNAEFCYHIVPTEFDSFDCEHFESNPMEFYLVCTDVTTGKPLYKKCDKMDYEGMEWIRASASMPLVSRLVEIDGYKLLDGGITDSIPIKYLEGLGYNRNVVVLTQPKDYIKDKNKLLPLMKLSLRKYPNLLNAVKCRHEMYNETVRYICEKEKRGELFVIRPEKALEIGHMEHDGERMVAVYQQGRLTASKCIDELKKYLQTE